MRKGKGKRVGPRPPFTPHSGTSKARGRGICSTSQVAEYCALWGKLPNDSGRSKLKVQRENKEVLHRPPTPSSVEAGNALYELKQERKVVLRRKYKKRGRGDGIPSWK